MAGVATVVAFHAHPDDEVLLSGGTLAKLAADGHRVDFSSDYPADLRSVLDILAAES